MPSNRPVLVFLLLHLNVATTAAWTSYASSLPFSPPPPSALLFSTVFLTSLRLAAAILFLLVVYPGPIRLRQALAKLPTQLLAVAKELWEDWTGPGGVSTFLYNMIKGGERSRSAQLGTFLGGLRYLPEDLAHGLFRSSSSGPSSSSVAVSQQEHKPPRGWGILWLAVVLLCTVTLGLWGHHKLVTARTVVKAAKDVTLKELGDDLARALLQAATWTKTFKTETAEL